MCAGKYPTDAARSPASPLSCFIAAASSTDISVVRSLLLARAIRPVTISDLISEGLSFTESTDAISKADLVIAVLEQSGTSPNVYFEIGSAVALKKRLVIIAPPGMKEPPFDLSSFPIVRASPDNADAIDFALSQTLAAPKTKRRTRRAPTLLSKPIGDRADQLLSQLYSIGHEPTEHELLKLVTEALRASGYLYLQINDQTGADMAIWSDELGRWVGNPFKIEIKQRLSNKLEQIYGWTQIGGRLPEPANEWFLVLYLEAAPGVLDRFEKSPILILGIRELLDQLRTKSFASIVIGLRNQKIHTVSY